VEGLPVVFGALFDWKLHRNVRLRVDALGVFRTAGNFTDKRSDLGYLLRTELRAGGPPAYGIEFRAFDDVTPVEDWGLRAGEVGWAAFLFQRDYRDYYLSKGVAGRAFVQPDRSLRLDIDAQHDWQTSVGARDPWTVFRNSQAWRPNAPIDGGHYTTLAGTLTFDTRNDRLDPTAGWFLRAPLAALVVWVRGPPGRKREVSVHAPRPGPRRPRGRGTGLARGQRAGSPPRRSAPDAGQLARRPRSGHRLGRARSVRGEGGDRRRAAAIHAATRSPLLR